jgi:DNA-binding transcriptional regulator YhcF (GntR family)
VELNKENKVDLMNRVYSRLLEKQFVEEVTTKDSIVSELNSMRKMTKEFKKTEEESQKIVYELNLKVEMARDETKASVQSSENKLSQLIRDFVNVYKKLALDFGSYKSMIAREYDLL